MFSGHNDILLINTDCSVIFSTWISKQKNPVALLGGCATGLIQNMYKMNIALRDILINNSNLTGSTKTVLFTLFTYLHGDKKECWPSVRDMSEVSGLSRRTVQRGLRLLEEMSYILILKQNNRKSNLYKMICIDSVQNDMRQGDAQSIPPKGELKPHVENVDLALPLQKNPKPSESDVPVIKEKSQKTESVMERWNRLIAAKAIEEASNPEPVQKPVKKESEASNSRIEKRNECKRLEFKGNWNSLEKIVEIWEVFTGNNWVKASENEFIEFLSTYSAIARKTKLPENNKKRVKNPFGYLVMLFKAGLSKQIIRRKDEEKALLVKRDLFRAGLYPQF